MEGRTTINDVEHDCSNIIQICSHDERLDFCLYLNHISNARERFGALWACRTLFTAFVNKIDTIQLSVVAIRKGFETWNFPQSHVHLSGVGWLF